MLLPQKGFVRFAGGIERSIIHQMTIHPKISPARCNRCYLSGPPAPPPAPLVIIQLKIKLFADMIHIKMKSV